MSKLARAAAEGIVAGAVLAACTEPRVVSAPMSASSASAEPVAIEARDAGPPKVKRADSRGRSKGCCAGKNECKGRSSCAVEGQSECAGKNECKGKGTQCLGVDLE